MSYRVDTETLLFDNLTPEEREELTGFASRIVLEGYVDLQHPAFVSWATALGYDDRQALLTISISFPQRALLSIIRSYR